MAWTRAGLPWLALVRPALGLDMRWSWLVLSWLGLGLDMRWHGLRLRWPSLILALC